MPDTFCDMTRDEKLTTERAEISSAMEQADEFERLLFNQYDCWRSFDWVRHHLSESGWQHGGAPITLKGSYRSSLLIPLLVAHEVGIISSPNTFPLHLLRARERFGEHPNEGSVYLRFLTSENSNPRGLLEQHLQKMQTHLDVIAWQRETFPMRSLNDIDRELARNCR